MYNNYQQISTFQKKCVDNTRLQKYFGTYTIGSAIHGAILTFTRTFKGDKITMDLGEFGKLHVGIRKLKGKKAMACIDAAITLSKKAIDVIENGISDDEDLHIGNAELTKAVDESIKSSCYFRGTPTKKKDKEEYELLKDPDASLMIDVIMTDYLREMHSSYNGSIVLCDFALGELYYESDTNHGLFLNKNTKLSLKNDALLELIEANNIKVKEL
jgi:hypothetical protein